MSPRQVFPIAISDIVIEKRKRRNFDHVPGLAESIKSLGQISPILIDKNNVLIAGECRIKARQLNGDTHIDAIYVPDEMTSDRLDMEISENIERQGFTVTEKVDIAIELEQRIKEGGERRGKSKQDIEKSDDVNPDGGPGLGMETRDYVAKRAGFKSSRSYRNAREVTEKAIPEVVEAMDKGQLSITGAFKIANTPKRKQLSALEEAKRFYDSDGTELAKSQTERRKVKRKDRLGLPQKTPKHQQFNVIRFAPDWVGMPECEILDTPINDFASPRIAVLAIECNSSTLPQTFNLLDHFGFGYAGIVTIHNPKIPDTVSYHFVNSKSSHIVFGMRVGDGDVGEVIQLNTVRKISPVLSRNTTDLESALLPIIEQLFPNSEDRRIDMSSSVKRKNWICWRTSYGIGQEPEEEDIPLDQTDAFEQAAIVDDDDETDHIEVEQLGGRAITAADILDQEESEASFEPAPRKLKIF